MWNNNTIEDEIQRNSLEYGVSVNTDRSIPDAKSGLKPVAKRIIYDAFIEKRTADKPHVKSARIVGDVMGRFHPHGDSSIYGAMIRLSQDWVLRYPLIDIHGNNGNILGDGPAAQRYTEARLSKIAEDGLLYGLNKNNVDYILNYDESENEPVTLPAIFPNLLCNPNEGIGWAMGCSWAPHNLKEVAQAIFDYTENKEPMLPGPDFPTGGVIINKDDIPNIMKTGRGSVKIRGKYHIEDRNIIFTEIPYGTRLEALMDEIGKACEAEKVNGIVDIRNETGKKNGLKLVIETAKTANIKSVLNQLFLKTNLQSSFSYNQVALVGKTPTNLNLKEAIQIYLNHNIDCLIKEFNFDLDKAKKRLHIVEGLLIALEDIDNVIVLIKKSENSNAAKESLKEKYKLSEIQAKSILAMRLSSLAHMEKIELENEKQSLEKTIEEINNVLTLKEKQIEIICNRLKNLVNKYGDERRTELTQITITKEEKEIAHVEPEKCVVVMTQSGYIKRVAASSFKTQRRNGKGVKTQDDITNCIIRTNTIDNLMVFTNKGKMYRILVDDIPAGNNTTKGQLLNSLIEFDNDEKPVLIYSIYRDTDAKYLLFTTKNGLVKKTSLEEYIKTKKKNGIAAINIKDGDMLADVILIKNEDVLLVTKNGMTIRFKSDAIGATGRATAGVKGINIKEDDYVIAALAIKDNNDELALFSENGMGKRVKLTEYPVQTRGGKGICSYKQKVGDATLVGKDDKVLIVGTTNSICINASELPILNRSAVGNNIIKSGNIRCVSKV